MNPSPPIEFKQQYNLKSYLINGFKWMLTWYFLSFIGPSVITLFSFCSIGHIFISERSMESFLQPISCKSCTLMEIFFSLKWFQSLWRTEIISIKVLIGTSYSSFHFWFYFRLKNNEFRSINNRMVKLIILIILQNNVFAFSFNRENYPNRKSFNLEDIPQAELRRNSRILRRTSRHRRSRRSPMLGLSPRSPMQLDQLSNFNIREL